MSRYLVCADMHGRRPTGRHLQAVGLVAECRGSRVTAWVRAPSRMTAMGWLASMLARAGYPVPPNALTVPVSIGEHLYRYPGDPICPNEVAR
jgi:hypothetical protein